VRKAPWPAGHASTSSAVRGSFPACDVGPVDFREFPRFAWTFAGETGSFAVGLTSNAFRLSAGLSDDIAGAPGGLSGDTVGVSDEFCEVTVGVSGERFENAAGVSAEL